MDEQALREIARTWSFWDRAPPPSVRRRVTLPARLRSEIALVIQGVRRCGKSTLMQQLMARYALDPQHCCCVNFEDPRLSNHLSWETLEALARTFEAMHPDAERLAFFLDEVQAVRGWERWLRSQLDRPGRNLFVVTGSNARLLSGELGSTLTGRHLTVELYPFDWEEACDAVPTLSFADYLHEGGFPAPLLEPDGDMLRRQYFQDIVERDLRERLGARASLPIRQVLQMVFESAGAEMSLRRVAAAAGIAVETAASYLEVAEQAYLLHSIPFFTWSAAQRAQRNRKYYPVDPGLRRVVVTPGSADRGKALECVTVTALRRRFPDVSYWRDSGEVDFVVRDGTRLVPIQVTWDQPQPRHQRALDAFYASFPQAQEAVWVTAENFGSLFGSGGELGGGAGA